MGPHVPSVPAPFFEATHASHVPVHALSQQTPSAQCPLAHSPSRPHAPLVFVDTHVPAEQYAEAVQSPSPAQLVRHATPAASQRYAPHKVVTVGRHARLPLQTPVPCVPETHIEAGHSTSGSVPSGMGQHTPLVWLVFAALHAWHVPVHAALQQRPSVQNPLAQSPFAVHGSPFWARSARE
jgi:hypothetical protein